LSVDIAGRIDWLTPRAAHWLKEFNLAHGSAQHCLVDDFLPNKLLNWFQTWRDHDGRPCANQVFAKGFSASISPCEQPGEFMWLLQLTELESSEAWSPEMLREKLKLTFREAEILMWIARGKTNKEIGIILNTSPRTVNKHLEHVFEKLGVSTRAAAVAVALKL
jgi:DNA-binding CsgD family transcriptional regulator